MVKFIKRVPNIDFLRISRFTIFVSLALIVTGVTSLIVRHGLNYGIEFTGGLFVEVHFDSLITTQEIRSALSEVGLGHAIIQRDVTTNYNFFIRTQLTENVTPELITKVLQEHFPNNPLRIERVEKIGAVISRGLKLRAFWVVICGLFIMLLYITVRFTYKFGIAAVIALIHDVLITIGILNILNREFTTAIIAALLTIIGYSINDSIVISDRIRENLRLYPKTPFPDIVNRSLNETLSRTIITSLTTIFVLLALFIVGGKVIHDFSLALLIGVITGTYSSLFVLSPIVVAWERRFPSPETRRRAYYKEKEERAVVTETPPEVTTPTPEERKGRILLPTPQKVDTISTKKKKKKKRKKKR